MLKHVGKMTVAAHRGDCYNYYEKTMTAFKKAIQEGVDMIETDVHLTKDGTLVLIHDNTVGRTTDGEGEIANMMAEELFKLNAGDVNMPEKIPCFEDVVKLVASQNIMLNIEIKEYYSEENEQRCISCIEKVIEIVEKYNLSEKIVLNCFDAWVLEYVYKKYGNKYMLHGVYPYSIMQNVTLNPDKHLYCACIFDDKNKEYYDYLIKKTLRHGLVRERRKKTDLIFVHSMVRNWLLQTIRQMLYIN